MVFKVPIDDEWRSVNRTVTECRSNLTVCYVGRSPESVTRSGLVFPDNSNKQKPGAAIISVVRPQLFSFLVSFFLLSIHSSYFISAVIQGVSGLSSQTENLIQGPQNKKKSIL